MKNLYNQTESTHTEQKASKETVQFLLNYSKSLSVVKTRGLIFERNLN